MTKKLMLALMVMLSLVVLTACGRNPIVPGGEEEGQGGVIVVTVLDGESPVAGATVQLRDGSNNVVSEGETDEEGQATIENVPSGTNYSVIAEKGGVTGSATNLRVSGTEKTIAQIVLAGNGNGGGIITGTVKVSGSDRPVAGATVEVIGSKLSKVTDNNGQFTLSGVPSGQQKVKVSCTGYNDAGRDVIVKDGSSVPVVVELYPISAGPRAGHTLITTAMRVLEVDSWHNVTMDYKTKGAGMARFVRQTGNVLVADTEGDKVVEYTSNGAISKKYDAKVALLFGGLEAPRGLSRTSSGNILVADSSNNRIVELDASDNKVWEYKTRLASPSYVERLSNGNTLVTDTGNNRVVEIDRSGNVVWGCGNGTSGVLNHPTFATRLPNGNTLITDAGNNRVMEVTSNNMYVWMCEYTFDENNEQLNLSHPGSAVRLANGNTLIADTGNDRVIEINSEYQLQWNMPVGQPTFAERI